MLRRIRPATPERKNIRRLRSIHPHPRREAGKHRTGREGAGNSTPAGRHASGGGTAGHGRQTAKKISRNYLQVLENIVSLHSQYQNGALVQLVRIRACHARGQGFESPTHRRVRRNKPKKPCKRIVYKAFSLFAADAGFVLREIPDARGECDRPRQTDKKAVAGINSGKSHPAPYPPPTPPDGRSRRR